MPKGIYPRIHGLQRPWMQRRKTIICKQCTKSFDVPKSTKRTFCGVECYLKHNVGSNSPCYKGGYVSVQGYRIFSNKNHKQAEHRVIAEKALGRLLQRGECVHHIDGNKTNNENDNLLICSIAYHQCLRARMAELYMLEHFGGSK